MEIKIDKDVVMPPSRQGSPVYPWADMTVGDSFAIPVPSDSPQKDNSLRRCAAMYGVRHNMKFSCRALMENDKRVIRVWRVA